MYDEFFAIQRTRTIHLLRTVKTISVCECRWQQQRTYFVFVLTKWENKQRLHVFKKKMKRKISHCIRSIYESRTRTVKVVNCFIMKIGWLKVRILRIFLCVIQFHLKRLESVVRSNNAISSSDIIIIIEIVCAIICWRLVISRRKFEKSIWRKHWLLFFYIVNN